MDCGETFRYVGPDHVCYKTLRKLEADSERLDRLEETQIDPKSPNRNVPMTLPSTTKEPTFESLVEEFREAVRSAVLYRHAESYERKCRSALLDYVRKLEENALTDEEANAIQAWIYNSLPTADMSSSSRHRNTALMKLRRISRSAPQLKDK